jgi:hypothetical protein
VPSAADVADAFTTPCCSACTVAVPTGPPLATLVTVPENVPLVTALNVTPLLACPLTVTVTAPVVTELGTVALMEVALQVGAAAGSPLKRTTLVPWLAPKFCPVIVTAEPGAPLLGERFVMLGPGVTVNVTPLLFVPPAFTSTVPVEAPLGTGTTILESLQLNGVAAVPLNWTALVPCAIPNPAPVIVTKVLTAPVVGAMLAMLGGGITVNPAELDAPAWTTTTGPVVEPAGTGAII